MSPVATLIIHLEKVLCFVLSSAKSLTVLLILFYETQVGNVPVVLVKWKVMDENGSKVLIVENCGVLPEYRRRGLARRTMHEIVQLCTGVTELHSCVMYLPSTPWIPAKLSGYSLPCKVEKFSAGSGQPAAQWKEYVSVWNPQQLGIAMSR